MKNATTRKRANINGMSRRDEIEYIVFGCLNDLPSEYGINYSRALKISRLLIDNGVRVVGI
jgi:hypothetical protein